MHIVIQEHSRDRKEPDNKLKYFHIKFSWKTVRGLSHQKTKPKIDSQLRSQCRLDQGDRGTKIKSIGSTWREGCFGGGDQGIEGKNYRYLKEYCWGAAESVTRGNLAQDSNLKRV